MILGASRRERLSRRARGAVRRLAVRQGAVGRRAAAARAARRDGRGADRAGLRADGDERSRGGARARARARQNVSARAAAVQARQGVPPEGPRAAEDRRRARSSAREVVKELQRLERAAKGGAEATQLGGARPGGDALAPRRARRRRRRRSAATITARRALAELGFDSLMFTELAVALEAAGVAVPDRGRAHRPRDRRRCREAGRAARGEARSEKPKRDRLRREKARGHGDADEIDVPRPLVAARPRGARAGGSARLYERVLDTARHRHARTSRRSAASSSRRTTRATSTWASSSTRSASGATRWSRSAAKDYFFEDPVSAPTSRTSRTWCRWSATARCASRCGSPAR